MSWPESEEALDTPKMGRLQKAWGRSRSTNPAQENKHVLSKF